MSPLFSRVIIIFTVALAQVSPFYSFAFSEGIPLLNATDTIVGQDANIFLVNTPNNAPLDISLFEYFEIVGRNISSQIKLSLKLWLVFGLNGDCNNPITYWEWLPSCRFNFDASSNRDIAYSTWKHRQETNEKVLCQVKLEILPESKPFDPFYLQSIRFLNVKKTCDESKPPSPPGFVWRNQSHLVFKGKPFKFLSFVAINLLNGTEFEQEDIIRTIVSFTNGTNAIVKTTELGTAPEGPLDFQYDACKAYCTYTNVTGVYNGANLLKVDRMIAIATKYNVKLVIPFFKVQGGIANQALIRSILDIDAFFYDPNIRNETRSFIETILNRTNTFSTRMILP